MGLKTLIVDQMLSRLPISLAQLKAEIILKSIKMKSDNYCTLLNWLKQSIIIWSTLLKNGNNLYEHWK